MNKKQYKEYRRNQRICYSNEEGLAGIPYFQIIPLERAGEPRTGWKDLNEAWERYKREYEWVTPNNPTWPGQKEMVLVGHNNPRAANSLRAYIKNNMRYF